MIPEFLFLLKYQGLKKILLNIKSMRQARTPIRGYVTTTCFWALMETGFMDALTGHGTVSVTEFSQHRRIDPAILSYICQYLNRVGYLAQDGDRMTLSAQGRAFWANANGVMNIFCAYEPFFKNLVALLQRQTSLHDLKRRDDYVACGFRETGPRLTFDIMSRIIADLGVKNVIELGCGNIDLSLYLSQQHPEMKFLGIDWDDHYLDQARKTISKRTIENRVQLLKQDLFQLDGTDADFSEYDLVTAIDLFHGYFFQGKERLVELFKGLGRTFSGKGFLVSEVCLPDEEKMKNLSYPHVEHELFHNLTHQRTFKQGELEGLLRECGFEVEKRWYVRNLGARIFVKFRSSAIHAGGGNREPGDPFSPSGGKGGEGEINAVTDPCPPSFAKDSEGRQPLL